MNPAFRRSFNFDLVEQPTLRLGDIVPLSERASAESGLRDLFACNLESVEIAWTPVAPSSIPAKWTAWRIPALGSEPAQALLMEKKGTAAPPPVAVEDSLLQAQRWEAVGRLAGGVVHDFNNLLTGVMLYTDLLLSSIDPRDRRRRYADEIRSAILQATGLVRQLLVFARPQKIQIRALCLNQIVQGMKDLLTRLIGENITLEFRLDPDLGLLKIDQAQAQQIILNLILNARDAMPNGGRIVVETSNCRFQAVAGSTLSEQAASAFPCILFTVADNGCGMDEKTRQRLFEPFFTTKNAGKGTGLGLTTVRSIVTTHRGLIHVESEVGRGTRVMILLPRASQTADAVLLGSPTLEDQNSDLDLTSKSFHANQKEQTL
jgi:signal transduction histidine kinase